MKKYKYLGHNITHDYYCLLKSPYSFNDLQIHVEKIENDDFIHVSRGWGGIISEQRFVKTVLKNNPRRFELRTPLKFSGADYDWGHEYGWDIKIDEIIEMEG